MREPILTANVVVALVSAVVVLASSFGFPLSEEQRAAIIGLTVVVAPIIAAFWSRERSTSLVNPTDSDGVKLFRVDNRPLVFEMNKLHEEALKLNKEIEISRKWDNID